MHALPPLPLGFSPVPDGCLATVVTYLEMTSQPASRDVTSAGLTLHRHAAHDVAAYRALFRAVGADWLWFSRLRMELGTLEALLGDPLVEAYAVHDGDEAVGLLELDFRERGACELAFFGLTASHTGRGVGRWLMEEAIRRAWSRDITRFHVHTCTLDHPAAVAFYVRSGFTPYRRAVEVAPDPRLTGELPVHVGAHTPVVTSGVVPTGVPDPAAVVHEFWRLMGTNDFAAVSAVLSADFVLEWPQSRERIRGAARFAQMNQEYPAHGPWRFAVHRTVGHGDQVVTDTGVTDGQTKGHALTFFTVRNGLIDQITEFWPEPFTAPPNRAHLVESMD